MYKIKTQPDCFCQDLKLYVATVLTSARLNCLGGSPFLAAVDTPIVADDDVARQRAASEDNRRRIQMSLTSSLPLSTKVSLHWASFISGCESNKSSLAPVKRSAKNVQVLYN
jgi:hypothetical protein